MIGIYKIENLITHQVYISMSKDIKKRFNAHKNNAYKKNNKEYFKSLYQSIRQYGLDNFSFEVLEECAEEELAEKENKYILLFNSNNPLYGYNRTSGYEYSQYGVTGECHPNHKLTLEDVINIRESYGKLEDKNTVYEKYKHKIGYSGFTKIWNNETWKNVKQDVYTEKNKQYYLFKRNSHAGSSNPKAKLNEQDVNDIRRRKKNNEKFSDVYELYKNKNISKGTFKNIWNNIGWKNCTGL